MVYESVGSASVFKNGMKIEVVDKMRISQVRVATVVDITWYMMTRMALRVAGSGVMRRVL